jgi:hypothetical protein
MNVGKSIPRCNVLLMPVMVLLLMVQTGAGRAEAGAAVDWDAVAGRTIDLFAPGQASWEWLLTPANHASGARRMREGSTCRTCHEGEEQTMGARIIAHQALEPAPLRGMPGAIAADLEIQHDGGNLHLRVSWPSLLGTSPAGESSVPARATVMLGSEALPIARIAGCWASCHSDSPGMPAEHPETLTKYLANSRARMTPTGGGTELRTEAQLAQELEEGRFMEYWQAKFSRDGVHEAVDGYILEARRRNAEAAFTAAARLDGDRWVVEITRPLVPGAGPRIALEPGRVYTLSLAIHDNHASSRHHYVSFPLQMALDEGDVDIVVTRP